MLFMLMFNWLNNYCYFRQISIFKFFSFSSNIVNINRYNSQAKKTLGSPQSFLRNQKDHESKLENQYSD